MVDAHAVRRAIYNNGSVAETLGSYVGCQANAVLGYRCLNRNLPDVTAAKAIERAGQVRARVRVRVRVRVRFRVRVRVRVRVRTLCPNPNPNPNQFRFIGLESEWALSVCLFNFVMSGTRYVTQGQLVNLRPTDTTSGQSTRYNETLTLPLPLPLPLTLTLTLTLTLP